MSAIPGGSAVAPGAHIRVAFRVCYVFPHAEAPLLISRLRGWSVSRARELPVERTELNIAPGARLHGCSGPALSPDSRLPLSAVGAGRGSRSGLESPEWVT